MIAEPIRRYLTSRGVRYHRVIHAPCFTAQETAESAHVSGKHFAKAVLLKGAVPDGLPHYLLAVLPAHAKVSLDRLSEELGQRQVLASEEETALVFPGIQVGALPPLGDLGHVPVVADASLARAGWIVFHAGVLTELIEITWDDYARVVAPRVIDFARLPM